MNIFPKETGTERSDGSVGTYEVGWARNYRNFSDKEFIGPKGRIRLIYQEYRQDHPEEGDLIEYYSYPGHYEMINIKGELKKTGVQLRALVEMIEQNRDPTGLMQLTFMLYLAQ